MIEPLTPQPDNDSSSRVGVLSVGRALDGGGLDCEISGRDCIVLRRGASDAA